MRYQDGDQPMSQGRMRTSHWRHAVAALLFVCASGVMSLMGQGVPTQTAPRPASSSAFDQPLNWLLEARRNFTAVKDYTCTLSKRENVSGTLSDEHIIEAKFRTEPFSVYMRWLAPTKFYNQEAAFVLGRNNNKMRVHSKGLIKGAVGFVSVDLNDRRVMEQSRHTIYEAGIGNLIEQAIKYVQAEKEAGTGQVRTTEVILDNRRCLRVEIVQTQRRQQAEFYRTVLYLDKDSKLPIRAENYDWPRTGAPPALAMGALMEQVSFTNLRWNLGLTDREFNK
jgi:hypothetical protein